MDSRSGRALHQPPHLVPAKTVPKRISKVVGGNTVRQPIRISTAALPPAQRYGPAVADAPASDLNRASPRSRETSDQCSGKVSGPGEKPAMERRTDDEGHVVARARRAKTARIGTPTYAIATVSGVRSKTASTNALSDSREVVSSAFRSPRPAAPRPEMANANHSHAARKKRHRPNEWTRFRCMTRVA